MMQNIYVLISAFDCILSFYIFYYYLSNISTTNQKRIVIMPYILLAGISLYAVNQFNISLLNAVVTLVFTFVMTLFFNLKWGMRFVWTFSFAGFAAIFESISSVVVGSVTGTTLEEVIASPTFRIENELLSRFLLFITVVIVTRTIKSRLQTSDIPLSEILYLSITPAISIATILFIAYLGAYSSSNTFVSVLTLVLSLALLLSNITIFVLYDRISKQYVLSSRMAMLSRIQTEQHTLYEQLTKQIRYNNFFQHETKRDLALVKQLIESNQDSEAAMLASSISNKLVQLSDTDQILTQNPILDVILSTKKEECTKNSITLDVKMQYSNFSFLSPSDTASIFGNLFDNAIASTASLPEPKMKKIELVTAIQGHTLLISMSNPIHQAVKRKGGKIVSTKPNAHDHGFGLEIIEVVVKNLGGTFRIADTKNEFVANIKLLVPDHT